MLKSRNRHRSARRMPDRAVLEALEARILQDGEPIQVEKLASVSCGCNGSTQITYSYNVQAAVGGTPFYNIRLVDDNGTPSKTSDDFTPNYLSGDTNNNGLLEFGEVWKYSKTISVTACKGTTITNIVTLQGDAMISGSVFTVTATDSATVTIGNCTTSCNPCQPPPCKPTYCSKDWYCAPKTYCSSKYDCNNYSSWCRNTCTSDRYNCYDRNDCYSGWNDCNTRYNNDCYSRYNDCNYRSNDCYSSWNDCNSYSRNCW